MGKCECGRIIDDNSIEKCLAFDLQKGHKQIEFCSKECREEWIKRKQIGMWGTLILGVIISLILLFDGETELSVMLLFLPYMIRQVAYGLKDVFDGGTGGEIISFIVVLLGTITLIYPAYKFIQEFLEYKKLLAE